MAQVVVPGDDPGPPRMAIIPDKPNRGMIK
jgi:hypothetical protein